MTIPKKSLSTPAVPESARMGCSSGIRLRQVQHVLLLSIVLVLTGWLGACKKKEPPPPPPPPPPPKAPPPPQPLDVATLLQTMKVDPRVEFAQSQAPVNESLAKAAINLADAFARGDDEALRSMLDKRQQSILDSLIATEQWYEATEPIEAVRIVSIDAGSRLNPDPTTTTIGIAIQDPNGAYVLGWSGRKVLDDWLFTAIPTDSKEQRSAKAFDGRLPLARSADAGVDTNSLFADMPAESLAALAQFGLDPNNPDPAKLQSFIDEMGDRLPDEVVEQLRSLLEMLQKQLGTDSTSANEDEAASPSDDGGEERPSRRRNTPHGPVDVPGGG